MNISTTQRAWSLRHKGALLLAGFLLEDCTEVANIDLNYGILIRRSSREVAAHFVVLAVVELSGPTARSGVEEKQNT